MIPEIGLNKRSFRIDRKPAAYIPRRALTTGNTKVARWNMGLKTHSLFRWCFHLDFHIEIPTKNSLVFDTYPMFRNYHPSGLLPSDLRFLRYRTSLNWIIRERHCCRDL